MALQGEREVPIMISETLFREKELNDIDGFKRGHDYVEVKCGCTSKKYGDAIGLLRVFASGQFQITCDCSPVCKRGKRFTPYEFEKHTGKGGRNRWKSHIWVVMKDKKVPLWKTPLLKYYKHIANGASGFMKRVFHRDEFIKCYKCKKERRFRLRTKEQCRIYHDASLNERWKCADSLHSKITCKDDEERVSRKNCRGCPDWPSCSGCTSCVCFGCLKCRFLDCNCRTCVDFMQNAAP
ncbi:protein ULTRAPETALA 2 isoform X2 [Jatropha curcas]|uniref:protein ULTRAPETALA 2 isoform X2 n=1 Tax=Jatropha curcas TaxID=180498 RepID=UPI001894AD30|nr:protein ULTRAPETALA 2 isoform X2 [Jatropha curcas]